MGRDDNKCDRFNIIKKIVKTNQDITELSQSIKISQSLHGIGMAYLSQTQLAVQSGKLQLPGLIDKDIVRKTISKMKNGKAAGPSGILLEMVKAAR